MDSTEREAPWGESVEIAVQRRLEGIESGTYRRNVRNALTRFFGWLAEERGVTELDEIDVIDCRRYAQQLRREVQRGHLSASSAGEDGPYFTIVRGFLEWCVKDERLDTNPAKPARVAEELPEDRGEADRQFWTKEVRNSILEYVDRRAEAALEDDDTDTETAFRDRALVYVVALSGARGAELFRDPEDKRRDGIRWSDVDFDRGLVHVLGKTREYEWIQLPSDAVDRLERYRRVADPPTDEWPVFPSYHYPSLAEAAKEQLDLTDEQYRERKGDQHIVEFVREREVCPQSISTVAARRIVRELSEESGITIDGEPLKLHGARRGLGDQLYSEGSAELAQDVLRHRSIETTYESYRDTKMVERRKDVESVLGDE